MERDYEWKKEQEEMDFRKMFSRIRTTSKIYLLWLLLHIVLL